MHLDEDHVQRLLDGELPLGEAEAARGHLVGCPECRRRVDEMEREVVEVGALLRGADEAPPRLVAREIAAVARRRDAIRLRWAAGIGLMLALGGAVYAAPGSPLRAWVAATLGTTSAPSDRSPATPDRAPRSDPGVGGVAVAPGSDLVIHFTWPQAEGQLQVSLTDSSEVVVRAPSGAATFTTDVARLVIDNQGSRASFEIQIPRSAPRVEIRAAGIRIFLKEGSRVTAGKSAESHGTYVLPLTPPPS